MVDGGLVHLEPGFDAAVAEALRAKGHQVRIGADAGFGGCQGIARRQGGVYLGASESRRTGTRPATGEA